MRPGCRRSLWYWSDSNKSYRLASGYIVFNKVLFPALAQVQNDPRRLALGYLSAVSIVATVTLPLSALMWLFAPEIVALWLGRLATGTAPF